jgi:hypothetical protein
VNEAELKTESNGRLPLRASSGTAGGGAGVEYWQYVGGRSGKLGLGNGGAIRGAEESDPAAEDRLSYFGSIGGILSGASVVGAVGV